MPFILRKIRKSRWYNSERVLWLPAGEVQADALNDLQTIGNELSVWLIEDNKSNLNQVITALAANTEHVSNFDYILFSQQLLSRTDISMKESKGVSPDDHANANWHRDLVELSVGKLADLARQIQRQGEKARILQKNVVNRIVEGVRSGRIEMTRLKPKVQVKMTAAGL